MREEEEGEEEGVEVVVMSIEGVSEGGYRPNEEREREGDTERRGRGRGEYHPLGGIINTLVQDTPAPPCQPSVRREPKPDRPLLHFYTPSQKKVFRRAVARTRSRKKKKNYKRRRRSGRRRWGGEEKNSLYWTWRSHDDALQPLLEATSSDTCQCPVIIIITFLSTFR